MPGDADGNRGAIPGLLGGARAEACATAAGRGGLTGCGGGDFCASAAETWSLGQGVDWSRTAWVSYFSGLARIFGSPGNWYLISKIIIID